MRFLSKAILAVLLAGTGSLGGADPASVDFSRDIWPILVDRCHSCHGAEKQKGGLRLDRRQEALQGGDSGKAWIPGRSGESKLVHLIQGTNPDEVMPPKGEKLTAAQIDLIRRWIDSGATWSESALLPGAGNQDRSHWAFRQPVRPVPPAVKDKRWVRNPIDHFVLASLEQKKIGPSFEASRPTLIRRLYLDLLGLIPSTEEVQRFVNDREPRAYERLVDRTLASGHFGERWGRHWLDQARYADSDGYEKDSIRPYAYLYRDWVIDAINRDLPFDQFTILQLAGDLLPGAGLEQKIATGFHRQTLINKEGGVDQEEFRCKATVDRASTTATVWLGLTLACAECHSHKYDPISQREFYQFYAFFNDANDADLPAPQPLELADYEKAKQSWEQQRAELQTNYHRFTQEQIPARLAKWRERILRDTPDWGPDSPELLPLDVWTALIQTNRTPEQKVTLEKFHLEKVDPDARKHRARLEQHAKKEPKYPPTKAAVVTALEKPRDTRIHIRGDFLRKGDPVDPGTLQVLHPFQSSTNRPTRLDLARWLVDPANPLTARVTANQFWKHLFGRPLVATVDDFGTRGDKPTHPELLDWLATEFQRLGWSRKEMLRLILSSATYRQSADGRPELRDADPNNLLLARQNRFRMEAETVRDLHLTASGLLHPRIGGPSVRPPLPADIAAIGYANSVKWKESEGEDRYRRGLYIFFQRTVPYPMLMTFDAPDSNSSCTRRERSNTPLQALTLMNDPVFFECARVLGREWAAGPLRSRSEKIDQLFQQCLNRRPEADEKARLEKLASETELLLRRSAGSAEKIIGQSVDDPGNAQEAALWVTMARTLMNLDEFVTRE